MTQDLDDQFSNEFADLARALALPAPREMCGVVFRQAALPRLRTALLRLLKVSILLVWLPLAAAAADSTTPAFDQAAYEQCLQLPERAHERKRPHAATLLQHTHQDSPALGVPAKVTQLFDRIVKAAAPEISVQPRLAGYASNHRKAFVTSNGVVFLSETTWRGSSSWADDEVAAILAHEIAHLVREDSARRTCEFAALMGFSSNNPAAVENELHSRVGGGDLDLGVEMFRRNHAREHAADALGLELLVKAGFPPEAMARMLSKLVDPGAGPSGTHPDTLERVQNVQRLTLARAIPSTSRVAKH